VRELLERNKIGNIGQKSLFELCSSIGIAASNAQGLPGPNLLPFKATPANDSANDLTV
jgi:hypothetical protein